MRSRLDSLLSPADLPLAELCAARLDGEVFGVDECFCPVDFPAGRTERGAALAAIAPARVIAEQASAAWVWGAIAEPPVPHRLCVDTLSRVHPSTPARIIVREVVIDPGDVVSIGGMPVTSVLRTCSDLTRFSGDFPARDRSAVLALLRLGGASPDDCIAYLSIRRNLPHKRRAIERLRLLG